MAKPGDILQGRYKIVGFIKRGGQGAVYEAEDLRLKIIVALKESFYGYDEHLRREFEREAQLLARLEHPALPKVWDHFIEDEVQFLVMTFIPGDDLGKMLKDNRGGFPVDKVLIWADKLLRALEYLHGQESPVIHRDIKPGNLKLKGNEEIVLLDFGLAKGGTKMSLSAVTFEYAPFEQINREGTDARSDLYSLAATLYELMTGMQPPSALSRKVSNPDPLRPANEINSEVPPAVANVLMQAMSQDRDARPASAADMRRMLEEAQRNVEESKPPSVEIVEPSKEPKKVVQSVGNSEPTLILPPDSLLTYDFETVTLNVKGEVIDKKPGQARYFSEDLGGGVMLEMVEIPGNEFWMGTADDEVERVKKEFERYYSKEQAATWSRWETPQHKVNVPSFFMGKFQVTQAQWRAVAGLPKVERDLKVEPSKFEGNTLPVEQVSWEDAEEFCARLSNKTRKTYRLPSEAEWEYACRAETTTPFAFGETITPEFVNYNGKYPYGSGSKGEYREKTTAVGSVGKPNAFGLYDMHGNVWEWCKDPWHENYNGAPSDGSVWEDKGDKSYRVLRGGSWVNSGGYLCRSADRNRNTPVGRYVDIGFRVVSVVRTR